MYWMTSKAPAENKTARVGLVFRVFFDDFPVKNREKDLVECELIGFSFLIGMIANADSVPAYCLDYILDVHKLEPLCQFSIIQFSDKAFVHNAMEVYIRRE